MEESTAQHLSLSGQALTSTFEIDEVSTVAYQPITTEDAPVMANIPEKFKNFHLYLLTRGGSVDAENKSVKQSESINLDEILESSLSIRQFEADEPLRLESDLDQKYTQYTSLSKKDRTARQRLFCREDCVAGSCATCSGSMRKPPSTVIINVEPESNEESESAESASEESESDKKESVESGSDESESDKKESVEGGSDESESAESGSDESESAESGSGESKSADSVSEISASAESGSGESGSEERGSRDNLSNENGSRDNLSNENGSAQSFSEDSVSDESESVQEQSDNDQELINPDIDPLLPILAGGFSNPILIHEHAWDDFYLRQLKKGGPNAAAMKSNGIRDGQALTPFCKGHQEGRAFVCNLTGFANQAIHVEQVVPFLNLPSSGLASAVTTSQNHLLHNILHFTEGDFRSGTGVACGGHNRDAINVFCQERHDGEPDITHQLDFVCCLRSTQDLAQLTDMELLLSDGRRLIEELRQKAHNSSIFFCKFPLLTELQIHLVLSISRCFEKTVIIYRPKEGLQGILFHRKKDDIAWIAELEEMRLNIIQGAMQNNEEQLFVGLIPNDLGMTQVDNLRVYNNALLTLDTGKMLAKLC